MEFPIKVFITKYGIHPERPAEDYAIAQARLQQDIESNRTDGKVQQASYSTWVRYYDTLEHAEEFRDVLMGLERPDHPFIKSITIK